ncbi:MAG: GNAT family N-acetyltransferase [Actinobacteria bacterium]|nr:GNAT family N-acetyltransferase [Actinomycetota bacterium]MCA1720032.1 GNAT family N-acetyltransferase [Actinomycetota bacterium]
MQLRFTADPAEFLASAEAFLAGNPLVSTVVTTMAHRMLAERADGVPAPERYWWATASDERGRLVGAAMRTARAEPHPPYLLPMSTHAAVALARELHARGEEVAGANGALPAVRAFADELARLGGGRVDVAQHTRLHELTALVPPAPVPGRLRPATADDADVATAWLAEFMGDADEQAGRARGSTAHEAPDRDGVLRRVRDGRLWFWCDDQGVRVHLLGAGPPAFGVARIGPVYTPPQQRGRGWASNAVAELSRRLLADGTRVCLFTDQANPASNKIYAALGYRPVLDMVNLLIAR